MGVDEVSGQSTAMSKITDTQVRVGLRTYEPQATIRMEIPRWGCGEARPTAASNPTPRNWDFIFGTVGEALKVGRERVRP